ncbi:related to bZIP transcription factor [Cephalotrichum gorgonifer]|uniref:Related to bZIP transcription factor n=1 Tax=Cephalotrichum gorgonifer TaxID=2041049 RepID=A0AAE8N2A9_9PEZI|nr:related to bZIP transcription factor [Cephalotrichum gorgonifer]
MSGASQQSDALEGFFDFSEYENVTSYQSPSLSPETTSKNTFAARSMSQVATPILSSASSQQPTLSGPSHQYELYKQQTGIVPGALASTLAINQNNNMPGYNPVDLGYLGLSPAEDVFDFNTAPSGSLGVSEMDMEFDSNTTDQFFFDDTVNPTALADQASPSMASQSSNVGRLWPGMHSQAAMAKAQQAQRQQPVQRPSGGPAKPRAKSSQPADPIVEAKITQLLNSMRAKPASEVGAGGMQSNHMPRIKKDEEEMDEDERLLASEEGKKLSSKERRQLRNKVSARAFRSRRKEYITQLESEISGKVAENGELRSQNRALIEENKRLSDLTRMLLASPSFSDLLNQMSTNPVPVPQQQQQQAPQVQSQPAQQDQQQSRQPPKDPNPYAAAMHQQQIGMAMIPEHSMEFSSLSLENDNFNLQPQVFAFAAPEMPSSIDATVLSGKSSNFVGECMDSEDEKLQMPVLDHPKSLEPSAPTAPPLDPAFESNPEFELYHSQPVSSSTSTEDEEAWRADVFGGIESEKVLARYELVDAAEAEQDSMLAMVKVQRMCERLEATRARIDDLLDL